MTGLQPKGPLKEGDAWVNLQKYYDDNGASINILDMFNKDPDRFDKLSLRLATPQDGEILVDLSKNKIDDTVKDLLLALAKERQVEEARDAMFTGQKINFTEDRAVLHIALRNRSVKLLNWRCGVFWGVGADQAYRKI